MLGMLNYGLETMRTYNGGPVFFCVARTVPMERSAGRVFAEKLLPERVMRGHAASLSQISPNHEVVDSKKKCMLLDRDRPESVER